MPRTPDEILKLLDEAQISVNDDCVGNHPYDLRALMWEIIKDVQSSYELAMDGFDDYVNDETLRKRIHSVVDDYLGNHYGDD